VQDGSESFGFLDATIFQVNRNDPRRHCGNLSSVGVYEERYKANDYFACVCDEGREHGLAARVRIVNFLRRVIGGPQKSRQDALFRFARSHDQNVAADKERGRLCLEFVKRENVSVFGRVGHKPIAKFELPQKRPRSSFIQLKNLYFQRNHICRK
jgi:hypothetical protein